MRKHFDDQIAQLGEQMMAMGALVENTIERAIRALQTDDMAEAAAIRDGDHVVDEKEREVEAMCIHMLLQQQPVARDLRTISAALKMITDMERIGDQASDICEIARWVICAVRARSISRRWRRRRFRWCTARLTRTSIKTLSWRSRWNCPTTLWTRCSTT